MPVLKASNLAKAYKGREVIKDVSLSINSGEIVGLLGPNGAGKTTCFYMIVGIVNADRGRIQLDDKDLTPLSIQGRAKHGVGYLPQEASIFRKLSVADNIMAILETRSDLNRKQRKLLRRSTWELRFLYKIKGIAARLGIGLSAYK